MPGCARELLAAAAKGGDVDVLQALTPRLPDNELGQALALALYVASVHNHRPALSWLLHQDVPTEQVNWAAAQELALRTACDRGHFASVQILVDHCHATFTQEHFSRVVSRGLAVACKASRYPVAELLLDLSACSVEGVQAALRASVDTNHTNTNLTSLLIHSGADARDPYTLARALEHGDVHVLHTLLQYVAMRHGCSELAETCCPRRRRSATWRPCSCC